MCHHYFSADAICNCPKPSNLDYNDQSGNYNDGKFKIKIPTIHILKNMLCNKLIKQSLSEAFF